ncbi:hypothetical protein H7I75_23160, partial [Mycobacterium stomatepiae]|nr:hypothetical protein [Mycobacterium stomatepiae]
IGLALALVMTGWRVIRVKVTSEQVGEAWLVSITGACTFLALPRLTGVLARIPAGARVILDISTTYLDHAAEQALDDWQQQHCANGGTVVRPGQSGEDADSSCTTCAPEVRLEVSPEALAHAVHNDVPALGVPGSSRNGRA